MWKNLTIFLITTIFRTGNTNAQEIPEKGELWNRIGVTTVNFRNESSEILVLISEKYDSVNFKVLKAPILIEHLVFFYETGENQDIKLNMLVEPGKESPSIDLTGGERKLMKIEFYYKLPPGKKYQSSVIELWGIPGQP